MSVNRLQQISVRDQSLNLRSETVLTNGLSNSGPSNISIQLITQTGSSTTTVDCGLLPKNNVLVTTLNFTTSPHSYNGFFLLNSNILTTSIIKATITSYSNVYAGQGLPISFTYNVSAGSCEIGLMNAGLNAVSGTFKIFVEILQSL